MPTDGVSSSRVPLQFWFFVNPLHLLSIRWHSNIIWKINNLPGFAVSALLFSTQANDCSARCPISGVPLLGRSLSLMARLEGRLGAFSAILCFEYVRTSDDYMALEGVLQRVFSPKALMALMRNLGNDPNTKSPKFTVRTTPFHCLPFS